MFLGLFFLFCSGMTLLAQEPGHIGRRVWTSYEFSSSLGLFGSSWNRLNTEESTGFFLNTRHSWNAEYALSHRFSVGAGFQHFRTGKEIYSPYTGVEHLHAKMNLKGVGLSFRWFPTRRRGSVAPHGPYTQLQIFRYFCRVTEPSGQFYRNQNTNLGLVPTTGVFFTFGETFVVKKRLLFDFGFQTGFSPGWWSVLTTSPGAHPFAKLRNSVHYRITGHFLLNFKAGMGFLLF